MFGLLNPDDYEKGVVLRAVRPVRGETREWDVPGSKESATFTGQDRNPAICWSSWWVPSMSSLNHSLSQAVEPVIG